MNQPERLAAIRARVQAAAPAPWCARDSSESWSLHSGPMQILKAHKSCIRHAEYWPYPGDAEFIVHSREDVEWLLNEVVRLTRELEETNTDFTEFVLRYEGGGGGL